MRTVFAPRASTILYNLARRTAEHPGAYLLPANVCPIVPLTLLQARRRFEFVDLDPVSYSMAPAKIEERLADRSKPPVAAVLYVRTYGSERSVGSLFHGIHAATPAPLVIDDRCLCPPEPRSSRINDEGADVVLFSTGYSKFADIGWGGFAHFGDEVGYAAETREYRAADLDAVTAIYKEAINSASPLYTPATEARVSEGLRALHWLETSAPREPWASYEDRLLAARTQAVEHKRSINGIYRYGVPERLQLPADFHGWRFQIRVAGRDELLRRIFAAGLFASSHYYPAARLFGGLASSAADELAADVINLFNDARVSEADAERIAALVRDHALAAPSR